MKAISAVIATIMLLMISVSMIGVFYVFSSGIASTSTSSASEQTSQLTKQLSSCMQIDNIYDNQITLRNCGKGVIENKSLVVTMDDVKLGASTTTIQEGNSSVVNISGLWQVALGKHNLKISNGAAVAQALVDVQPNKDGLAGSWNFDEGSGNKANDGSGNGNVGTLNPSVSPPSWINGKFGKGLSFDGSNDNVTIPKSNSLKLDYFTVSAWFKIPSAGLNGKQSDIVTDRSDGCTRPNYGLYVETDNTIAGCFVAYNVNPNIHNWRCVGSGVVVSPETWYHGVLTYDRQNLKIYVNGVIKSTAAVTDEPDKNQNQYVVIGGTGCVYPGINYYTNGTIDEVRIWNRALAPDETVAMKQII